MRSSLATRGPEPSFGLIQTIGWSREWRECLSIDRDGPHLGDALPVVDDPWPWAVDQRTDLVAVELGLYEAVVNYDSVQESATTPRDPHDGVVWYLERDAGWDLGGAPHKASSSLGESRSEV